MKTFGRILLLIVSIVMVATAIPLIIYHWNALNATGWNDIANYPDKLSHLFSIIGKALYILCALVAFIAFIRGKASFRLILYAVILLIPAIIFFINANQAGQLSDWKVVADGIIGFIIPILYALGTIFVIL